MTRFMLDALDIRGLPAVIPETTLLASYVDHPEYHPQPFTQLQERYPNHTLVSIAAHGGDAQVCDVETGAMTPVHVPAWLVRQRSQGRTPWCYATTTNWALVRAFCQFAGVTKPLWWKADWSDGPVIPSDAIATQYASVPGWDSSVLLDYIPGFDPDPDPPITEDTDMFRIYQDPRSPAQYAIGGTWAVALDSQAQADVWASMPDYAGPVQIPDATHWDQLWRRVVTVSLAPGGEPLTPGTGQAPAT